MKSYKGSSRSAMSKQDMTECSDDGARSAHRSEDRAARGTDAAAQEEFVATLFAGVAPEDVARYGDAELVAFATTAWTFLATRKPGEPKIRLTSETYREGDRRNAISILE